MSNLCTVFTALQNPHPINAFLSPFWKSGDPLPSELCFSSSWTTMHGFLDSHICHNLLASDLIFYKPEEMAVTETWVQTVTWMGSRLQTVLLNPLHAQWAVLGCALSCCRIPVTQCITKRLEHLKVTNSTDGIPLWHKLNKLCILQHLKSQFPRSLWAEGIVLASFSCMMFVMPFHALSFSFQIKVDAANKFVNFDSILFHQPWGNILSLKSVLFHQQVGNVAGTISVVSQTLYHFLDHMVSYSSLCYHFPDCHESILNVPDTGSLQETTNGLIGNVRVPAFRMLYPSSDTASAHAHGSIYMVKSCMNIWCGNFLFNKKPYHWKLPIQHVFVSHFLTLKHDCMTEAGNVIFILVWDDRWD